MSSDPAVEPLPHQLGLGVSGKAALASGAAMLSLAYPSSAVVLAGAAAGLQAVGERLNALQLERTSELLAAAGTKSSLTLEEVVQQLVHRDDLVLMTAEALDAARRTRLQGKAGALGRSLGSILLDDALIDQESIWIRIMGIIEPAHIRLLGLLLGPNSGTRPGCWAPSFTLTVEEAGLRLNLGEAVLPLVQDLLGAGLVMNPGRDGASFVSPDGFGQGIEATGLGAQLFDRLAVDGVGSAN